MSVAALDRIEDGGELFREREEPAIGSRLLIAQSIDEATGGKTSAGDAGGEPWLVNFGKEAGDLAPTGALARFAGISYEHEKEVQTVAGSIHHAVGSTADHVAEDCQKLKEPVRKKEGESEQAERLARAELRALRAQISPHFIYNALAAIAGYIHSNPEEARELLLDAAREMIASYRDEGREPPIGGGHTEPLTIDLATA